ncbi:MAG: hypothetical protein ABIP61_03825 [Burkholderiaceae bacterium]
MGTAAVRPSHPKPEWIRRFAYRVMLVQPEVDSISAAMIADTQFDEAFDLEPEDAAEIYALGPALVPPSRTDDS